MLKSNSQEKWGLFQLAAQLLQEETDKWEEENNSIVMVAKEMAHQMLEIAKFARGRNRLQVPQMYPNRGCVDHCMVL